VTDGRQVHLGSVVSYALWILAWVLIIVATALDSHRVAWPGLTVMGMAAVSSARSFLAEHDRATARRFALMREVEQQHSDLRRVR
jgi:hypothetical protein